MTNDDDDDERTSIGKSILQYIKVFKTHELMISDRFLVPEIEIANPPDAI